MVQTELSPDGEGTCPLFDASGERLGDVNDLIRIRSRLGNEWPESFVDQGNGSYFRVSMDGLGYGTSVVGCPGFRTMAHMHFIPTPRRMEISGDPESCTIRNEGTLHERDREVARVRGRRTWHRPPDGRGPVTVDVHSELEILENLPLSTATEFLGKDRFRWFMLSSMYVNDITYDGNLLRFEDADGRLREISISEHYRVNHRKRWDGHLFETPVPVGDWLELVKTTGSTWLPRSPGIRYDLEDTGGMQLGVQGWWSGSDNPDDDNLNVWLEWLDPPRVLEPGMQRAVTVRVRSLPCQERRVPVSLPPRPRRWWWKPTDYAHRMEYGYAPTS